MFGADGEIVCLATPQVANIVRMLHHCCATSFEIFVGSGIGEVYLMPRRRVAAGKRVWTLPDCVHYGHRRNVSTVV